MATQQELDAVKQAGRDDYTRGVRNAAIPGDMVDPDRQAAWLAGWEEAARDEEFVATEGAEEADEDEDDCFDFDDFDSPYDEPQDPNRPAAKWRFPV